MLDGRSCVVPRLFSGTCQAENDWSYMKCLLELDIKNGKRPMEIDDVEEDEPHQPRKCTKKLDSCHRNESAAGEATIGLVVATTMCDAVLMPLGGRCNG